MISINLSTGVNGIINSEEELRDYVDFQTAHVRDLGEGLYDDNVVVFLAFITDEHTVTFRFSDKTTDEEAMNAILERVPFETMRVFIWQDVRSATVFTAGMAHTHVVTDGEPLYRKILVAELFDWSRQPLQGADVDFTGYFPTTQIGHVTLSLRTDLEL